MWKTLSKKTILKTKVFSVTEETCAKKDKTIINNFYVIHPKNVVVIIPLTEKNKIVVIKQYRHSVKKTDYELPAGHIENKDKKNIKQAAIRELLEETGYTPKTLKLIYTAYSSIGKQDNKVFYFLAKRCKKTQEPNLEKDEEIETKVISIKKSLDLLSQNKFKDNASVCAMLMLKNMHNA